MSRFPPCQWISSCGWRCSFAGRSISPRPGQGKLTTVVRRKYICPLFLRLALLHRFIFSPLTFNQLSLFNSKSLLDHHPTVSSQNRSLPAPTTFTMRFATIFVAAAAATVSYAQNLEDIIGDVINNPDLQNIVSSLATDPGFQSVASEVMTATGTDFLSNSYIQSIYSELQTNSAVLSAGSALATNSEISSLASDFESVTESVGSATADSTGASQTASGSSAVSTEDSGADRVALGAMAAGAVGVFGLAALL